MRRGSTDGASARGLAALLELAPPAQELEILARALGVGAALGVGGQDLVGGDGLVEAPELLEAARAPIRFGRIRRAAFEQRQRAVEAALTVVGSRQAQRIGCVARLLEAALVRCALGLGSVGLLGCVR